MSVDHPAARTAAGLAVHMLLPLAPPLLTAGGVTRRGPHEARWWP